MTVLEPLYVYFSLVPSSVLKRPSQQGTNYVPVSLPKPKKLVNPFAARQAEAEAAALAAQQPSTPSKTPVSATGAKKLTWSERQALAKKQQAEEEEKSRVASGFSKAGLVSAARAVQDAVEKEEPTYEEEEETAPPPPPPPPVAVEQSAPVGEVAEEEVEYPSNVQKPGAMHGALSGKVALVSYDYDVSCLFPCG
jgi:drebrin-like protein